MTRSGSSPSTAGSRRSRSALDGLLGEDLIGVGRYDALRDRDEAEVAFFIDDQHQGRGVATILLELR